MDSYKTIAERVSDLAARLGALKSELSKVQTEIGESGLVKRFSLFRELPKYHVHYMLNV